MSDTPAMPTALNDPRESLSEDERALVDDVAEYGFHAVSVGQSAADAELLRHWRDVPDWTYTIGLVVSFGHPEIVVFSLNREIVMPLLWDVAEDIRSGRRFEPRTIYSDALESFPGQRCAFEEVSPAWAASLFGWGHWFYKGAPFPVLQYLWPDRNGNFAWDNSATEALRAAQRLLHHAPATEDAAPPPWS